MKDIRHKLYPAIIVMLMVVLGASLLSRWQISIETEPAPSPLPRDEANTPSPTPARSPAPSPAASETPPKGDEASADRPSPIATASPNTTGVDRSGSLRVSNRTTQPLRVALLPSDGKQYQEPVQWDFAPEEGSDRGLKLSLPEGDLQVREGDVVVAFAQDGSRRYWGPYVIGKTNLPRWVSASQEWQLVLQPE